MRHFKTLLVHGADSWAPLANGRMSQFVPVPICMPIRACGAGGDASLRTYRHHLAGNAGTIEHGEYVRVCARVRKEDHGDQRYRSFAGPAVCAQECAEVEEINSDLRALVERMKVQMFENGGCGLAAPQVGETIQLAIVDTEYTSEKDYDPYVLINP